MTLHVQALCIDAIDPDALASFWAGVLRRHQDTSDDFPVLLPGTDTDLTIRFAPTTDAKTEPNQVHFDLTSTTEQDQQDTVARALELGGRHIDIGQRPEEGHVVLADPEGNEFCVIQPGNAFLADTGPIGALSGDGSQQVGYFWSRALGWPLVWDQDEETAIQSPSGGAKFTWGGGPPVRRKTAKNRIHLDLAPSPDDDAASEVARLLSLGATRADIGQGTVGWDVLADPDGNEFCVKQPAGMSRTPSSER